MSLFHQTDSNKYESAVSSQLTNDASRPYGILDFASLKVKWYFFQSVVNDWDEYPRTMLRKAWKKQELQKTNEYQLVKGSKLFKRPKCNMWRTNLLSEHMIFTFAVARSTGYPTMRVWVWGPLTGTLKSSSVVFFLGLVRSAIWKEWSQSTNQEPRF